MATGLRSNCTGGKGPNTPGHSGATTGRMPRRASTRSYRAPSTPRAACNLPPTIPKSNSNAPIGRPTNSGCGKSEPEFEVDDPFTRIVIVSRNRTEPHRFIQRSSGHHRGQRVQAHRAIADASGLGEDGFGELAAQIAAAKLRRHI